MRSGGEIGFAFERRNQSRVGGRIRLLLTWRRHHASLQLADHSFGEFSVVAGLRDVEVLERHVAAFELVVMAVAAVGLDEPVQLGGCSRSRVRRPLRLGRHKARPERNCRAQQGYRDSERSRACDSSCHSPSTPQRNPLIKGNITLVSGRSRRFYAA